MTEVRMTEETIMSSISREERVALIERLRRLLPVSWDNETDGHGEPTHAVLTFGEHQTQAITLCPDDWMVLNELPAALSVDERLIEALTETRRVLVETFHCQPHGPAVQRIDAALSTTKADQ